jgi:hypothetical protein
MKAYWGMSATHSLTSALDGGEWSASRPGRFTPRERDPGTHWTGGWVSPRAVLDAVKSKIPSPRRESNPRIPIVQPIAQRYTDWAITALSTWSVTEVKSTAMHLPTPPLQTSLNPNFATYRKPLAKFEVLTAMKIQEHFSVVTPCSTVVRYQSFGAPGCIHLQG